MSASNEVIPVNRWERLALWVLPPLAERARRRQAEQVRLLLRVIDKVSATHPDYAHIRPDRHLHLMK